MTEDEALKKVCCGPRNGAHQDDDIFCKASACMAWRPLHEDRGVWGRKANAGGFCGLAGRPE